MESKWMWAKRKAQDLINAETWGDKAVDAFARYIVAHEEPEVDPLLVEAREIAAYVHEQTPSRLRNVHGRTVLEIAAEMRAGKSDDSPMVRAALEALRRKARP